MNKFLVIISFFILSSCSYLDNEKNYKGLYTYGHEVHSFKPCSEEIYFWVSFNWAGLEMHEFYKSTKKAPYVAMYIEFRGQVLNEVVGGFAEEYSGLMRISKVSEYTFKIPASCK